MRRATVRYDHADRVEVCALENAWRDRVDQCRLAALARALWRTGLPSDVLRLIAAHNEERACDASAVRGRAGEYEVELRPRAGLARR
jgi:hypothetical protein